MAKKFILIYITNPTLAEARKIAKHLLKKELIACANIHRANGLYFWKEKFADTTEYILIGKTIEKNFEGIKKEVKKIHSYAIPCVIKIPAEPNEAFFGWVKNELR